MRKTLLLVQLSLLSLLANSQDDDYLARERKKLSGKKDTGDVRVFINIGSFYHNTENNDSAMYYFREALSISEKYSFPRGLCWSYGCLGNMSYTYAKYGEALDYYYKSLAIAELHKMDKLMAASYNNIAHVFADQHNYTKAIEISLRTEDVYKKLKDTMGLARLYRGLCDYYNELNDEANAMKYGDQSLAFSNLFLSRPNLPTLDAQSLEEVRRNVKYIAVCILEKRKEYDKALRACLELVESANNLEGVQEKATYENKLAILYVLKKDFQKSLEHSAKVMELIKKDSMPYLLQDIYKVMSAAYEGLGMHDKALESYKLFKQQSDSIFNKENLSITTEMDAKYETGKKDGQILALGKEKRSQRIIIGLATGAALIALAFLLIAYRSKKLQQKLFTQKELLLRKEKELETNALQRKMSELEQMALRAQMNPHFIFNSLNSVQHFVMNGDVEGVNKYLAAFAHLIRQTLNNSGKQFVSLNEEIKYLETYLSLEKMKTNNAFSYSISIDEGIDSSATFIPGMILQPFVENSIKHGIAHKEKKDGQINIQISQNGKLICLIEDNGIGRQKAGEIKNIKSGQGYDSKGMTITMNRIDTINKIYNTDIYVQVNDLKDAEGLPEGTQVKIEFPVDME